MTEQLSGHIHPGLPSASQCRRCESTSQYSEMAAAVFQTVKTDHNHTSAGLYVPPDSPTMPPSPPWKVTGSYCTTVNTVL